MNPLGGTAKIKNISGAPYDVEECPGVTIPAGEIVDLLDTSLPSHYAVFSDAVRLLTTSTESKLYQDIAAGTIEVVELLPPFGG